MKTVQEHARALGDPTRHALTAQGNELWEAAIRQPATRKTVPLHVISAPEGGRLGDLNTGPNGSARVWSSVQTGVRAAGR